MGRKNRGTTHISDSNLIKRIDKATLRHFVPPLLCMDSVTQNKFWTESHLRKERLCLGHSSTVNGVSRQNLVVSEQWLVVSDQKKSAKAVILYSKRYGKSPLITDH